jgi:DNA-binding LacI/PurR family transcriptional regulator
LLDPDKPMKRQNKKLKLADVARVAKVSPATVSRLITGVAGVNPETRDRIMKAALRLGFDLERGKKSRIIAFLLSNRDVLHPFHSAVLMGAEAYCAEHDYALLFLPLHYSTALASVALDLPEILQRRKIISGVIVAGTNSQNLLNLLTRRGIPWVALGNNVVGEQPPEQAGAVYFDDVGGAYELTRYLQSLGHRHIGFVGNLRMPWYARRYQGYQRAMEEANLIPRLGELNSKDAEEMGYLTTRLILQQLPPLTAIFAGDDTAARGAYKAVRDSGLNIPEDISIAGFNDTLEASSLHPLLTTVRVFTNELGKQMAELLFKRIRRPDVPTRNTALPTQLVKRESCAPPPAKQRPPSNSAEKAAAHTSR